MDGERKRPSTRGRDANLHILKGEGEHQCVLPYEYEMKGRVGWRGEGEKRERKRARQKKLSRPLTKYGR